MKKEFSRRASTPEKDTIFKNFLNKLMKKNAIGVYKVHFAHKPMTMVRFGFWNCQTFSQIIQKYSITKVLRRRKSLKIQKKTELESEKKYSSAGNP